MLFINPQYISTCRLVSATCKYWRTSLRYKSSGKPLKPPEGCPPRKENEPITTSFGAPIGQKNASLTVGPRGPTLMQDAQFIDELAHFNRERVPERVVHAKGAGAFGYFEVTHDITEYTAARIFEKVGKRTIAAVRFSTVGGELGSADTVRDVRGGAFKFYTDEGIWDVVGNNTPVFFIRDPILFPSLIHSQKRNPKTYLHDPDTFWDFAVLRPEMMHQLVILFGDRGIPDGYRHMHCYGGHTFKLTNTSRRSVYCKFHFKTDQCIKCLSSEEAAELAGTDPDYSIRDLHDAIAGGECPTWSMFIQVMTMQEAQDSTYHPFDITKIWSHGDYPLIPVGKLTLNRNPEDYFTQVEQIGFHPGAMVPGIEPSPDRVLIGRMFAYADTQRYRIGANYTQLPVNRSAGVQNFQRDGPMTYDNQKGTPNYFPNSFGTIGNSSRTQKLNVPYGITGDVSRYDTGDEDNFSQARVLYTKIFDKNAKDRFYSNVLESLKGASTRIQKSAIDRFDELDRELGKKLLKALRFEGDHCGK